MTDTHGASRTERDLALLQGAWEQVGFEENGVANPPDEHGAPGALTIISGHHFAVRTREGALLLEGHFTSTPPRRPRRSPGSTRSALTGAGRCRPAISSTAIASSSSRPTAGSHGRRCSARRRA